MISVLIIARPDAAEALARTLAALVPAAVEGVVREVVVVGASPDLARVADHAGCRVVVDLDEAAAATRADWVLVLEAGARLQNGWSESAAAHVEGGGGAARFTLDPSTRVSWRERWAARRRPFWRGRLAPRGDLGATGRALTLPGRIAPARG